MVAATSLPMERPIDDSASQADGDSFGCLLSQLGSRLREDPYRRAVVTVGTSDAHQRLRAESSNSGLTVLGQRLDRNIGITATGHPDSSSVHQPLRGTVSSQLTELVKGLCLWALCRDLVLVAQHIPGVDNQIVTWTGICLQQYFRESIQFRVP